MGKCVSANETKRRFCIVEYAPEEYTRHYIVQALFKLMSSYDYEKISVTDIAEKAGVGRATFYRYFKRKEDVVIYYFEHNKKSFMYEQRIYPRCKEDYVKIVTGVFTLFKQNKEPLKLIRAAHLEYIYLDYLNKNFAEKFQKEYTDKHIYNPYIYAGMLFNISMAWLDNDCAEDIDVLANLVVSAIYFN